jgi:hypothetical protein
MKKAVSGFIAADIWRLNAHKYNEVDFEPAEQTNDVVLKI